MLLSEIDERSHQTYMQQHKVVSDFSSVLRIRKKSPSVEPGSQTGTRSQTQAVIGGKFGRAGDFDGRV